MGKRAAEDELFMGNMSSIQRGGNGLLCNEKNDQSWKQDLNK